MTQEFYNNEGKLNGMRTTYYKNSKTAAEVSFVNGFKHGISKSFSQSGILINKINYKAGEMDGIAEFYDKEGQLIKKGTYLNGLKHGSWFEYENQQLVNELLYYYGSLEDNN
jgi:antitoxin component YwqK of YwqJK toxin-antitoxin module